MGFETVVSGYIAIEGDTSRTLEAIAALPIGEADDWPFLPGDIFSAPPQNRSAAYKGRTILAFGMCVKEINYDWAEWLQKFERFIESCQANKAFASLEIPYWRSEDWSGHFFYSWQRQSDGSYSFKGEPREFCKL